MALGFEITVFRADRTTIVARWSNSWGKHCIRGTQQFDRAVRDGHGSALCKSGYPVSYEILASAILPLEIHGECKFVNTNDITQDEMLYVEAWDMS